METPPEAVTGPFGQILGWVMWIICAAAIARITVIGGTLHQMRKDGGGFDEAGSLTAVAVGLVLVAGASGFAGALLVD